MRVHVRLSVEARLETQGVLIEPPEEVGRRLLTARSVGFTIGETIGISDRPAVGPSKIRKT